MKNYKINLYARLYLKNNIEQYETIIKSGSDNYEDLLKQVKVLKEELKELEEIKND